MVSLAEHVPRPFQDKRSGALVMFLNSELLVVRKESQRLSASDFSEADFLREPRLPPVVLCLSRPRIGVRRVLTT
jgi:hypothetical protein